MDSSSNFEEEATCNHRKLALLAVSLAKADTAQESDVVTFQSIFSIEDKKCKTPRLSIPGVSSLRLGHVTVTATRCCHGPTNPSYPPSPPRTSTTSSTSLARLGLCARPFALAGPPGVTRPTAGRFNQCRRQLPIPRLPKANSDYRLGTGGVIGGDTLTSERVDFHDLPWRYFLHHQP